FSGASVNRPASIERPRARMAHMKERPRRLRTRSLAAIVLLGGTLPAASQEPAAPPAAPSGTVYNIELIVFRATTAAGAAENWSAEAGERTIAGDESTSDSAQVGRFVAQRPTRPSPSTRAAACVSTSATTTTIRHSASSRWLRPPRGRVPPAASHA